MSSNPHPATTPTPRFLRPDWLARHDRCREAVARGAGVVFVGDSITQHWEDVPTLWAREFAPLNAVNAGIGSDATEHVLWRMRDMDFSLPPRLFVLLVGVNNLCPCGSLRGDSPATTAEGVHAILDCIAARSPGSRVLLLGVLPYAAERGWDDPMTPIRACNRVLETLADGKRVVFADVGAQITASDGSIDRARQPDGCHFSEAGYAVFAASIKPLILGMLE